jgi:Flp pilus assembly protein TadD
MRSGKHLSVMLTLLLAACGGGHSPTNAVKLDADMGDIALNAGTPMVALRLAEDELAKRPGDTDALIRQGQALTELGRLEEAREVLRKAVATAPRDVRAIVALGRVLLPVDPAAAGAEFELALRQDGRNAVALNNLGIARDLLGNHAEAEAAYRSALAAQPGMTGAKVNLALCLAMSGQGADAISLLRPIAEKPDATRKIKEDFAAVLTMAGNRDEAERILSSSLATSDVKPALEAFALARTGPTSAASAVVMPPLEPQAPLPTIPAPIAPARARQAPAAALAPVRIGPAAPAIPPAPVAPASAALAPTQASPAIASPATASPATVILAPAPATPAVPETLAPAPAAPAQTTPRRPTVRQEETMAPARVIPVSMTLASTAVAEPAEIQASPTAATAASPGVASGQDTPVASTRQAVVQLGALNSEEAAHSVWDELSKRLPDLLSTRQPAYTNIERGGHIFWRLRTSGFADIGQARKFCDHVRAGGGNCTALLS